MNLHDLFFPAEQDTEAIDFNSGFQLHHERLFPESCFESSSSESEVEVQPEEEVASEPEMVQVEDCQEAKVIPTDLVQESFEIEFVQAPQPLEVKAPQSSESDIIIAERQSSGSVEPSAESESSEEVEEVEMADEQPESVVDLSENQQDHLEESSSQAEQL